jgi:hypothetical protein
MNDWKCTLSRNVENREEKLVALVMGLLFDTDEEQAWAHVGKCKVCTNTLKRVTQSISLAGKTPTMPFSKAQAIIAQHDRIAALNSIHQTLVKISALKTILSGVNDFITSVFLYPLPHLEPVFGATRTAQIEALSPLGKVRYPIVFDIRAKRKTPPPRFIITVGGKEFNAGPKPLLLTEKELPLARNKEHDWEISILDTKGHRRQGPVGCFILCAQHEEDEIGDIEKRIKAGRISSKDAFVYLGAVMEKNGFFAEAAREYQEAYEIEKSGYVAVRIVICFKKMGLDYLQERWAKRADSV